MFLLRVTDSRGAVTQYIANSFPFRIGRAAQCDLRIDAPGVWETHAVISPATDGKFVIRSQGESLLLRNGESVTEAPLVAGDEWVLGSARVLIGLSPSHQKALGVSETLVWLLLFAVVMVQALVLASAR